jgi:parallel beta-helix repeat protein
METAAMETAAMDASSLPLAAPRDDAQAPPDVRTGAASGVDPAASAPPPSPQETATRKGRWRFRGPSSGGERLAGRRALGVSADGTGDCTSIGAALALVAPGGCIEVRPGVYREGLVLDRAVELYGSGAVDDVVVECATAACLLMYAETATIRGVSFRSTAGLGENRYYAVNIPSGELTLEDCQISSDSLAALAVHGQHARPIIRRCVIRNTGERGVLVYNYATGLFEQCDIYGQTICVRISGHAAPILRKCRIHGGRLGGVTFVEHGNGLLDECEISENGHHGISIRLASNPVIRRCRVNGNGWSAVSVADSSGAVVEGCDLTRNRRASWDIKDSARAAVIRRDNRDVG